MGIDESKLDTQERDIHRKANEMLAAGVDAPTFSAHFFGPESELCRLGTRREDREKILGSELYQWLKGKYEQLRFRDAASFDQETRAASGRLTVVVPKSLHSALKSEAASEGVSLSELIRLKLAVPYRQMTDLLVPLSEHKLRPVRSQ